MKNFEVQVEQKNGDVANVNLWAKNKVAAFGTVSRLGFKIKSVTKVG